MRGRLENSSAPRERETWVAEFQRIEGHFRWSDLQFGEYLKPEKKTRGSIRDYRYGILRNSALSSILLSQATLSVSSRPYVNVCLCALVLIIILPGKTTWISSFSLIPQVDTNVIAVTRFSADTAESVVMVSHSCFYDRSPHPAHHPFRKIMLNGRVRRILIEARTKNHSLGNPMDDFKWSDCVGRDLIRNKMQLTQ